jgi:hypothetical protein
MEPSRDEILKALEQVIAPELSGSTAATSRSRSR